MGKKYLQFFLVLFLSSIFISCSVSKPTTASVYDIIKFDNNKYPSTDTNKIVIYSNRLDIPQKYLEIGTIKWADEIDISKIKELAASNGADAVLKDGNNFILLLYKDKKEREKDVKTI